jgi:hypothetical protein
MVEKKFLQGMGPWHYYYQVKNELDFALRNKIRWNRPVSLRKSVSVSSILANCNAELNSSTRELVQTYHLDEIQLPFHRDLVEVNLYYLDLFIHAFENLPFDFPNPLTAVDVGPSDWFYLPALASFLNYYRCEQGRELHITGYEIDPYRVYRDFHARHNIAEQRINAFKHIQYYLKPFEGRTNMNDLVFQCFPFLFLRDHLSWGLPKRLFDPEKLLNDAVESLKQNGILLIINQGAAENQLQRSLLIDRGLQIITDFRFNSEFKQYDHEHYVLVVKK